MGCRRVGLTVRLRGATLNKGHDDFAGGCQHCTGENQQFESYDACMAFITGLPEVSPACAGEGKILGGDSRLCRFKHHFMIPFEPAAHCFHIGKGMSDTHGHTKCTDMECGDPEVLGGPMELLTLKPTPEMAACFAKADARSLTEEGGPKSPWATAQVCDTDRDDPPSATHHHGG